MHGYWRIVAVLALAFFIGRGGYILWRDYLPVDTEVDCGHEDAPFGQPAPVAQRDCLWQAYQAGKTGASGADGAPGTSNLPGGGAT